MVLQPFQASVKSRGEISLVFIDGEFTHCIRKKPSQGDFKVFYLFIQICLLRKRFFFFFLVFQ